VRSLNCAFRKGELSSVQKQGVITCIPKGDKQRDLIKNWRPISLLNVVYKIGSACIANRIKTVLPKLINDNQTGFVPNRYIGDNIRLIYDLIKYLDDTDLPGLLVNVDFEKAFDSLDWSFMFKAMQAFGFGQDICRWISTFYQNINSAVIVNGQVSRWFPISRGCRQGDPISPYLFVLCVEILAVMIRQNDEIKGIHINNVEHKISQYADDTEFILDGNRQSFELCMNELNRFGKRSGLFLNHGKTSVIWLGSQKNSLVRYMEHLGMEWNPDKFKVLGIWFTNNVEDCVQLNYSEKFEEVKRLMLLWIKRCITPLGRVAILKSLILSKLIHLWILLPNPPDHFMENLQKICFVFIWKDKQDRISRCTVQKHMKEGGLGVPNLKLFVKSLKLAWIRKFSGCNHKWKNIASVNSPFLNIVEWYGPNVVDTYRNNNSFWLDVFEAYRSFYREIEPACSQELLAEPVCFNERIKVGGLVLKHLDWYRKGIRCVGNFLDVNGNFLTCAEFKEKYNVNINFVTYIGCTLAMKKYMKRFELLIVNNEAETNNACLKRLYSVSKGSQVYYNILLSNVQRPKCCSKWEERLNDTIDWKKCFYHVSKITDINMKWFQIRILHRILGTNIVLKHMGITQNENCSFCNRERDRLEHIFWRCDVSRTFWDRLVELVNDKCQNTGNLRLSETLVLLGTDRAIKIDSVCAFILIFAKQYLYKCKLDSNIPDVNIFLRKLHYRYKIEEYNSFINFMYNDFAARWQPYRALLSFDDA